MTRAALRRPGVRIAIGIVLGTALAYVATVPALYAAQDGLIFPATGSTGDLPQGYDEIGLSTADGLQLRAGWRPPQPGKPVAVFFHGNGDSLSGAARATAVLADAGYGVMLAEYRGYGGNPGKPGEAGLYADGRAALAWLAGKGIASGRVVLIGNSMGSGVAVQLAREARVAALVLVSPYSSLPELAAQKLPWVPARWMVRHRFDNAAKLPLVAAPVLIQHGTADTMIAPGHAQTLGDAQPRARLELFPGLDHDLAWDRRAQERQRAWLELVLQPTQRHSPAGI
ncbi:alpha/beta hydrolase [Novosphingobium sp.]|uniref:alpha/beta hydrolase n=1 Tax=Novosphingobium sp. TaxID=1874826 RepID=UPI001ED7128A|nr:alpha/beta hydrolase [Novosphingobium sp.]MBK6802994.1 alpha/beta hydrolase [Novosphingobium sp.]MBK9012157.1 alpha/beta hydrolase [Novosphingobium sp.]